MKQNRARIIKHKSYPTNNRWDTVFSLLLTSLIIFILLFGTPILGALNADFLFESILGCDIKSGIFDNHNANNACMFYDWDIRSKVQAYSAPGVSFFLTPISFIGAFFDLLILWGLILLFAYYKKTHYQKQENMVSKVLYWVLKLFPFILILSLLLSPNRHDNQYVYKEKQNQTKSISQDKSSNHNFGNSIRL